MNPLKSTVQKCAAQHMGPWMIEPKWFAQAVAAVKEGTFKPYESNVTEPRPCSNVDEAGVVGEMRNDQFKVRYYIEPGGIAVIPFSGQVTKGESSFGGASSVWTRQSLRKAVNDERINAILLHIDSPGGTVSGTGDLADDIDQADALKPVYAYIEDLGASAAYWIASQARAIFANPTAQVGSIGTMTYVEDSSGAYEKAGIKVHLVSTGKFKGAWLDGLKVDEEYLQTVQTEVNDLNEHFLAGVLRGRTGMNREQLMGVADGRVFIADKAKQLGLIDQVSTLDAAMAAILQENSSMNAENFKTYAAEHPEAVADYIEQGKKVGKAEARAEEITRMKEIAAAFGAGEHPAVISFEAGHDPATAKLIADTAAAATQKAREQLAAKDLELEKLRAEKGTQGPLQVNHAPRTEESEGDTGEPNPEAEWEKDPTLAEQFTSKEVYVAYRKTELAGRIKRIKSEKK